MSTSHRVKKNVAVMATTDCSKPLSGRIVCELSSLT